MTSNLAFGNPYSQRTRCKKRQGQQAYFLAAKRQHALDPQRGAKFNLSATHKSNASPFSTSRKTCQFSGMKPMGQTRWKYHAFIDHLRPVRLMAALPISPGSTEHSRSPRDALPVPNHDESAAALHREGDRLCQLREMGVGSAARSEGAWKASKTTCRYHLNTKCRSALSTHWPKQSSLNWLVCV